MKTTLTRQFLICASFLGYPVAAAMAEDAAPAPAAQSADSGAAVQASTSEKPEFRGILTTAKGKRFLLSTPGATETQWVVVGDSFQGWKLVDFREAEGALVLRQDDGREITLSMAEKKVTPGEVKATVADADRVLKKMHFTEMLAKMMDQQKQAMSKMFAQQGGKLPRERPVRRWRLSSQRSWIRSSARWGGGHGAAGCADLQQRLHARRS